MISNDIILLLTNREDITCDFIVQALRERKIPFKRLNTDTFIDESNISISFPGSRASGIIESFENAKAIYYRRPMLPSLDGLIDRQDIKAYCKGEWQALYDSIYRCYQNKCLWINSPLSINLAENKPYQLQQAEQIGFLIPETRITNSKAIICQLFDSKSCITLKPLKNAIIPSKEGETIVFSQKITERCQIDEHLLRVAPLIAQQWIDKAYDLRITVIGNKVFATKIDSQVFPETVNDWRAGSNSIPPHSVYTLPEKVSQQCSALARQLNLYFGAIDMVRDKEGNYWFLEINPNGQWAWIETQTGFPLSNSIVDLLTLKEEPYGFLSVP